MTWMRHRTLMHSLLASNRAHNPGKCDRKVKSWQLRITGLRSRVWPKKDPTLQNLHSCWGTPIIRGTWLAS